MRVGILTTGDEVAAGQILNKNSYTLARFCEELSFEVIWHMTVLDDEKQIKLALQILDKECDLVFITGGLGPTVDDLTRFCLAKYLEKDLELNEDVLLDVKAKIESKKLSFKEGHKNQALFPLGATPVANKVGTAWGFGCGKMSDRDFPKFWAFPGPPAEMATCWDVFKNELSFKGQADKLFKIRCLLAAESDVAELVEPIVTKFGFKVGYRASPPVIEVKVWYSDHNSNSFKECEEEIRQILSNNWEISRHTEEPIFEIVDMVKENQKVSISDSVSDGMFLNKLSEQLSHRELLKVKYELNSENLDFSITSKNEVFISLKKVGEQLVVLKTESGNKSKLKLDLNHRLLKSPKRVFLYALEKM